MTKLLGNPKVKIIGPGTEEVVVIGVSPERLSPNHSHDGKYERVHPTRAKAGILAIKVKGHQSGSGKAIESALAAAVLNHFWTTCFAKRDNRLEGIPLDRQRFLSIGMSQLTGSHPSGSSLNETWWKVRMGLPLESDPNHHLLSIVGTYAEGFAIYGHYSFGLRKIGGDPNSDFAIDPRSPWEEKVPPNFKDWQNKGDYLISGLHVWPLYDWLYTQTHLRGLDVMIHCLSASTEQVRLMRALAERENMKEIAPFEVSRYNCATMGELVFESLLPVGEKISLPHPLADIPDRLARKIDRRFEKVAVVEVESQTEKNGRVRTPNWLVRPAPNPWKTYGFLFLNQVPELN